MKRPAILLAWLLTTQPAGAQAPECPPRPAAAASAPAESARDRGFLWRLSRDGRDSYLFGTIHLGRPDWSLPGPRTAEALRATDVLALEIDPTDADTQKSLNTATTESNAPLLTPPLQRRLARQVAVACLRPDTLAALHPAMQVVVLQMLAARWDGLEAAYGQDLMLALRARAEQRRVVALETAQRQMDAIVPDDAAVVRKMVEHALVQLERDTVRAALRRVAQLWESGDLDSIGAYERWCDCIFDEDDRRQFRRLNDERNPALADGIERLHADGSRVFAAVGALHMTGPQGLPTLLADRGFTVTRIVFDR